MKKKVLAILTLAILFVFSITPTAWAATIASGECGVQGDNVTWTLDDNGTLTISGTGAMADYSNVIDPAPWSNYKSKINDVIVLDNVTSIGSDAFYEFKNINTLYISDSVESIGDSAFHYCDNLSEVKLSKNLKTLGASAFRYCPSIKEIVIPDGVTIIQSVTFSGCTSLTSVVIPSGVTSIEEMAFQYCAISSLELPNTLESIGQMAFKECKSINEVELPDSLTFIARSAFLGCSNLSTVKISNNITNLPEGVFGNCNNLNTVNIPKSVVNIENNAFSGSGNIRDIYYAGSKEDWTKVKKGNSYFSNTTIHYSISDVYDYKITKNIGNLEANSGHYVVSGLQDETMRINAPIAEVTDIYIDSTKLINGSDYTLNDDNGLFINLSKNIFADLTNDVHTIAVEFREAGQSTGNLYKSVVQNFYIENEPVVDIPDIIAFYPENGKIMDLDKPSNGTSSVNYADKKLRIFFDKELANSGSNRATLDFSVGTLEIHKADDDSVVYSVKAVTDLPFWGESAPYNKAVRLENATLALDYGTQYYITMPAGFIKFTNGSASAAIAKGDWSFSTAEKEIDEPIQDTQYEVTYILNGGNIGALPAEKYYPTQKIKVINTVPTKSGYKFTGWWDGSKMYQPGDIFTMPNHKVELTATWEQPHTLTYALNGGYGSFAVEKHFAGDQFNISSSLPTREDYIFTGWWDGTNTYQPGAIYEMPDSDIMLTAGWSNISAEMQYVQYITNHSLSKADTESRKSIQNAIYNLMFKAQFRPTSGPKIDNINAVFTGSTSEIAKWHPQNIDSYSNKVNDSVLGTINLKEAASGCMSYALFAVNYVYGTNGSGITFNDVWNEENIRLFIEQNANPGTRISYANRNKSGFHAIVFLGEDIEKKGFYYLSYEGGASKSGTYHMLRADYTTYDKFVNNTAKTLAVRKINEGVYSIGTAKPVVRIVLQIHCPVEAYVALDGKILDSRNGSYSNDFGSVDRTEDSIVFDLVYNENYDFKIVGTDQGTMDLVVQYEDEDKTVVNMRKFQMIPVEKDLEINTSAFDYAGSFVLYENIGEENEKVWGAGIDETVIATDDSYSSRYNTPGFDYIISFNTDGGNLLERTNPDYIVQGEKYIMPSADKSGYTLKYWAIGARDSANTIRANETYTFTADTTVYAIWDRNTTANGNSTSGGGSNRSREYAVSVNSVTGGKVSVAPKTALKGDTVTITVTPNDGYKLDNLTVKDSSGNILELTKINENKYTFIMPDKTVTVDAQFVKIEVNKPDAEQKPEQTAINFVDVPTNAWFTKAIAYVVEKGMMNGYEDGRFGPNDNTTRGQIVIVLYRLEGEPTVTANNNFADVTNSQYYANAVAWAAANDIVNGYSSTEFAPDDNVTREQIAAILFRYAQYKGYDTTTTGDIGNFTDNAKVSDWSREAMVWNVDVGLINGDDGALRPQGSATRAEIATLLMRFVENVAK